MRSRCKVVPPCFTNSFFIHLKIVLLKWVRSRCSTDILRQVLMQNVKQSPLLVLWASRRPVHTFLHQLAMTLSCPTTTSISHEPPLEGAVHVALIEAVCCISALSPRRYTPRRRVIPSHGSTHCTPVREKAAAQL